jgi:hypothetical protein
MASKPLFGDEVAYVKAGELYIQHVLKGHRGFDECLQCNYEHPMFAKMLIGSSIFLLGPFLGETLAARLVGLLSGALTCALLCYLRKSV